MINASLPAVLRFRPIDFCLKSRFCDRRKDHPGKCNNKKPDERKFWKNSPFYKLRESEGDLARKSRNLICQETEVEISRQNITSKKMTWFHTKQLLRKDLMWQVSI